MRARKHSPLVTFRGDEFDRIADALGYTTEVSKAQLLGCDPSHLWRIRNGIRRPGHDFIAKAHAALPRVPITRLFHFGDVDDQAA